VETVEQLGRVDGVDLADEVGAGLLDAIGVVRREDPGMAEALLGELDESSVVVLEGEPLRAAQHALHVALADREAGAAPLDDGRSGAGEREQVMAGASG